LQAVAEAQAAELGQALVEAVHLCDPSHALVVKVDPAHESAAHEVARGV